MQHEKIRRQLPSTLPVDTRLAAAPDSVTHSPRQQQQAQQIAALQGSATAPGDTAQLMKGQQTDDRGLWRKYAPYVLGGTAPHENRGYLARWLPTALGGEPVPQAPAPKKPAPKPKPKPPPPTKRELKRLAALEREERRKERLLQEEAEPPEAIEPLDDISPLPVVDEPEPMLDPDPPKLSKKAKSRANAKARKAEERRQQEEREQALRTQARRARRARVTPGELPKTHAGKQTRFPSVVESESGSPADLVYRGMSINNVRNLRRGGGGAVFTAQAPTGTGTPLQHVVDDSEASPFLSFEAGGLDVSAGKYAPKPIDPDTNKPLGVTRKPGGFLKQEKSYTAESRRSHPGAKRVGYVGGITSDAGTERIDVSDEPKARGVFGTAPGESLKRRQKAVELAKADREVLVKPGLAGIPQAEVPFVAKVKEVDEAYYRKHVARQTPRKALGYYKGYGAEPTYTKLQIPEGYDGYEFGIGGDLQRSEDDSEDEMSDIEDPSLSDYESD